MSIGVHGLHLKAGFARQVRDILRLGVSRRAVSAPASLSMSRLLPLTSRCITFGVRVQGSGFRVQGAGFRVQGSGFRVQGAGFRVQGAGFKVL